MMIEDVWKMCKSNLIDLYSFDKHKRYMTSICQKINSDKCIGEFQFINCGECDSRIALLCLQTHNDNIYRHYYLDKGEDVTLCYDCDFSAKETHFDYVNNVLHYSDIEYYE
jgi:hypothetical protein